MATTPINQTRYPVSSDSPNVAQYFANLATDIDDNLVPRFLTEAERDGRITAPVNGMVCTVNGQFQLYIGFWRPLGLLPQSADRTTNVTNAAVPAGGTYTPAGVGLTLPALPVGHTVVIAMTTDFYVEGSMAPQSISNDIVPTRASKIGGHAGRSMSMSGLTASVHTRQTFQITSATAATFASTYATGLGTERAILLREDWTVWL